MEAGTSPSHPEKRHCFPMPGTQEPKSSFLLLQWISVALSLEFPFHHHGGCLNKPPTTPSITCLVLVLPSLPVPSLLWGGPTRRIFVHSRVADISTPAVGTAAGCCSSGEQGWGVGTLTSIPRRKKEAGIHSSLGGRAFTGEEAGQRKAAVCVLGGVNSLWRVPPKPPHPCWAHLLLAPVGLAGLSPPLSPCLCPGVPVLSP